MPKSKKNKVVHLTQVKKKGKDHKEDLMRDLRGYVAKFKNVYIFDIDQAKSSRVMNLRIKLKDIGHIYSGKNSLLSSTLKSVGAKTNTNFDELLEQVTGHRGFLFSDVKCNKLVELIEKEAPDFCKKLLGYAQIAPKTMTPMLVDGEDNVENDSGPAAVAESVSPKEAGKKKKKKMKKVKSIEKRPKEGSDNKGEKREVRFVKI